jgi:hypothetical protein
VRKKAVGAEIKDIINSEDHGKAVELTTQVLTPVLRLLRFTDGKTGATLGKVYDQMATIAATFDKPIEGLDDTIRERMWELFMARWTYFHEPVFTAAWFLDPEFIRGSCTWSEEKEFREVLREITSADHCEFGYTEMLAQWASLQTAINVESHGMHDKEAFCGKAQKMPPFEWARVFLYEWPAIQYVAQQLPSLACSASLCEHSWSIEGWMHSKKRNRLGQTFVERLVRAHTNLLMEGKLEDWRMLVRPWEIDMIIEDPEDGEEGNEE